MNIKYQNDSGNFCTLGDNELAHYNHNHDKLGRFASSTGSSGASQRGLRKLESHRVKAYGRQMHAEYKAKKANEKYIKRIEKIAKKQGVNTKNKLAYVISPSPRQNKKIEKDSARVERLEKKASGYAKDRIETEKFINKAIKNAEKKGYTVSSKETVRSSERGMDFVNVAIGISGPGAIGGMLAYNLKENSYDRKYANDYGGQTPTSIWSNKYKVTQKNKKHRR